MQKQSKSKMYIVRKYIMATSATQAIKKDKITPADEVWLDDEWKNKNLADAIGFKETPIEDCGEEDRQSRKRR